VPLPLYDAHNHLHDEWLAPHLATIERQLLDLGLVSAVVNGTSEADWPQVVEISRRTWICPSFGLHPWHVGNRSPAWLDQLQRLLEAHPAAGVGEIGLDRWMTDRACSDDPRLAGLRRAPLDEQLPAFRSQLSLAAALDRPATIHCLDAWGALHDSLRQAPALPACGFLIHAYSGPADLIKNFADLGAYFSFNGAFLDERKTRQRETFRHVPRARLLIETDSPAMPLPQAWRAHELPPSPVGSPVNHPGNLKATYHALAAFLGEPVATLASAVEDNFCRLFGPRTASEDARTSRPRIAA